jgi:hypothetical protein
MAATVSIVLCRLHWQLTDGDRTAYTRLTLLNLQVGQQDAEHILRSDSLGNVTERVDSSSPDSLLVCLEKVEQFETDTHPLLSGHLFCTTIG